MKRIVSLGIAVMLLAMILITPAVAHKDNASYGEVPKSADAITLDGDKDAVYDKGLKLNLVRQQVYDDPPTTTTGDAYIVWQDGFLYIFAEVKDSYLMPVDSYANQSGEPWMTDSFEAFLDFENNLDGNESEQFRIDAYGYRSFEFRASSGESSYGQDENVADGKFEGKAKIVSGGYNVEFKIPMTKAAGANVGMLLQINDMQDDDSTRCMVFSASSTDEAKSWEPATYDYIVLSADEVTAVVAEPEPEPAAAVEEAAAPAEAAPAPVAPVAAPANTVAVPQTGDAGIILAVIVLAICSAVLISKTKKSRV